MTDRRWVFGLLAGVILSVLSSDVAQGEEGMWPVDQFPRRKLPAAAASDARQEARWRRLIMRASLRLTGGGSAAFVSASGLVATNHHVVRSCLARLSTAGADLSTKGFIAHDMADERRCPGMTLQQLLEVREVSAQMAAGGQPIPGCGPGDEFECAVVRTAAGKGHELHRYRRFTDVRLVFAPESAVAFFGGDLDNFAFPRHALDVAFLRAYANGRPVQVADHFRWSDEPPRPGQVTFVAGAPSTTRRDFLAARLAFDRDVSLPDTIAELAELRGALAQFGQSGPAQQRAAEHLLAAVENNLKSARARQRALSEPGVWQRKLNDERALRAAARRSGLARRYGQGQRRLSVALSRRRALYDEFTLLVQRKGFQSNLFQVAQDLVRGADAGSGPEAIQFERRILGARVEPPELETLLLRLSLQRLRRGLPSDHSAVRAALNGDTPEAVASRVVENSQLASVDFRRRLWAGGKPAIETANDPMIQLARRVEPHLLAAASRWRVLVEAPLAAAEAALATVRALAGSSARYPEADGTLRVGRGLVPQGGDGSSTVDPLTTFEGLFRRATTAPPFLLPPRWQEVHRQFTSATALNFVTTNDIVAGSSGGPVLNEAGELIGLVFDGNGYVAAGKYLYDKTHSRAIAVSTAGIAEALRVVYDGRRLLAELGIARVPRPRTPLSPRQGRT